MRRGFLRTVSSALLLVSLVSMPHPGDTSQAFPEILDTYGHHVVFSEFYPCATAGDEYFSISCFGDLYFCLRNWSVTDGEGEIRFLVDFWLFPGKTLTMSFNTTSFWNAYHELPDFSLDSPEIGRLVEITGSFRLADAGDSLALKSADGVIVDFVVYGSVEGAQEGWLGQPIPAPRKGEVAKRLGVGGQFTDTDSAEDWQPFREFKYGYTEFGSADFGISAGAMTAFASPDCSFEVITTAIRDSKESICASTYEFSSSPLCVELVNAIGRGVRVRLLVDGAPAGGMDDAQIICLSALRIAGAEVLAVNGNLSKGVVQHIGALHAKYIVIDSSVSIVLSENLVEDGVPKDTVVGNRGWGAMISNPDLANSLLGLFSEDSRRDRPDVEDWLRDERFNASAIIQERNQSMSHQAILAPFTTTDLARVTVEVSPDGSIRRPFAVDLLQCERSLAIEQFQADLFWTSRWTGEKYLNPLVSCLIDGAAHGADVKILFDSSWFNAKRNGEVVDCLRENSTPDLSLKAELLDRQSPISILHNKGAVVDDMHSLIASNNWVSASFARNRELAIVIESKEVASYFLSVFNLDWVPDRSPPVCDAGPDAEVALGESLALDASACYDDRRIFEYSWDFDADGVADSQDLRPLYRGVVLGTHTVLLKVADTWGNVAFDEISVTVFDPDARGQREKTVAVPWILWPVPVAIAICAVLSALILRRRNGPEIRNLNHRPRS